jgi:branched-chain amino acid transport system ATP-binding protein
VVRVSQRYLAMAKGSVVAEGQVLNSREGLHELEGHVMV